MNRKTLWVWIVGLAATATVAAAQSDRLVNLGRTRFARVDEARDVFVQRFSDPSNGATCYVVLRESNGYTSAPAIACVPAHDRR